MRMTLSLMFASVPAAAFAHVGTAPHMHPHGVDGLLALGLLAAGAVAIFAAVTPIGPSSRPERPKASASPAAPIRFPA